MNAVVEIGVVKQHLIDPEICIRCNTCEATCPIGAITHDDNNYVVDPGKCNACMDCVSPCPTGAIDNWFQVPTCLPEFCFWPSMRVKVWLMGICVPSASTSVPCCVILLPCTL